MVVTTDYNHLYNLPKLRENRKMDKDEYKQFDMAALIVGAVIIIAALVMAFVF